jgi:glycosyltransferase involved in cell wall biosynthesis
MGSPKVSVIIPAYNGAQFLGETIQSVLGQTYSNFELIIVDDASTDNTSEIVNQFDDPRIKYYTQPYNQGVDAARLLAIQSSTGDIVAFLDQDDIFHPEKLQAHVELYEGHPEVGISYNSRFVVNYPANTIREILRPPQKLTLADLVLGFPIAPSDWMMRREWVHFMDLSQEPTLINGGEYVITGRLFLSGCLFAGIDRVLNYRRHHSGRIHSKLSVRCKNELMAQQRIFDDPRCPAEILAFRPLAFKNTYQYWAFIAFAQDETDLGQVFLREAVRLIPSILVGTPCEVVDYFLTCSLDDEKDDHGYLLRRIFAQLPAEMDCIKEQYEWAVGRGYLIKGIRACLWDYPGEKDDYFDQATKMKARFDESLVGLLAQYLLNYDREIGEVSARNKIKALMPYLEKVGGWATTRKVMGNYCINRAFHKYSIGEYSKVPKLTLDAIASDPRYLLNRGLFSITIRSFFNRQNTNLKEVHPPKEC